jgi:hypothetical protein
MVYLNIVSCENTMSLKFTPAGKSEIIVKNDGAAQGLLAYNLTDLLGVAGTSTSISMNFFAIGFDKYVTFDRLDIVEYDPGVHFSGNTAPAVVSWTPYSLRTQALYPNGFNVETTDYIVGTNGIVRNYRAISGGHCVIAGKYDGNVTYDKDIGIMVEGKDSSYVIVSKRKVAPVFYANEADLIAKANGSETPAGTSGYWLMNIGVLANDDESQLAVYQGATLDEAKTFAENSKNDFKAISKETFVEENTLYWDTYIAENKLPSPYIINLPAKE